MTFFEADKQSTWGVRRPKELSWIGNIGILDKYMNAVIEKVGSLTRKAQRSALPNPNGLSLKLHSEVRRYIMPLRR